MITDELLTTSTDALIFEFKFELMNKYAVGDAKIRVARGRNKVSTSSEDIVELNRMSAFSCLYYLCTCIMQRQ